MKGALESHAASPLLMSSVISFDSSPRTCTFLFSQLYPSVKTLISAHNLP